MSRSIGTDTEFLGLSRNHSRPNQSQLHQSINKVVVFNHTDTFRVRRLSSGVLALLLSCGAVGSVMGVAGYPPPYWEEATVAFASTIGFLLAGTRHYVSRFVFDRRSGLVAVRGHKLLGDMVTRPSIFHVRDLMFHGENSFGVFFRSHNSLIPRLWFIPKRSMVVMDRGLPMPLPQLSRDFQGTEASGLALVHSATPVPKKEGQEINFVTAAWERIWADDETGNTTSKVSSTAVVREPLRTLETKIARDGAWASAADERAFVDWLKKPIGK